MKTTFSLSQTSLQHYVLIRKWASDIEFFKIETAFLHRLLDEYFIRLTNGLFIQHLKNIGERLLILEKAESKADALIRRQLKEMEWMAKHLISENKDRVMDAQVELEFQMKSITCEFREIKRNIFKLVEQVIHTDNVVTR